VLHRHKRSSRRYALLRGAPATADLRDVVRALVRAEVRFVVIDGFALQLHGSSYTTFDLDLAYERSRENAQRVVAALKPFSPRLRGIADELPFVFDPQTLMMSEILTLDTAAGDVDLLAAVQGIGPYARVERMADAFDFEGRRLYVLNVDGLIAAKRAAGRPKDEPGLIELEALREARAPFAVVSSAPGACRDGGAPSRERRPLAHSGRGCTLHIAKSRLCSPEYCPMQAQSSPSFCR
jgi:hypothetical protein